MEQGFWAPNPQPGSLRKGGLSLGSRLLGRPHGPWRSGFGPLDLWCLGGGCREKGHWLPQGQTCRCLGLN